MMDLKKDIKDFDDIFFVSDGVFCINEDKKNEFINDRKYGIDDQKDRRGDIEHNYDMNSNKLHLKIADELELPFDKREHPIETYQKNIDFLEFKRNILYDVFDCIRKNAYDRYANDYKEFINSIFKNDDLNKSCNEIILNFGENCGYPCFNIYKHDYDEKKEKSIEFAYKLNETEQLINKDGRFNSLDFIHKKSGLKIAIFMFESKELLSGFKDDLELFTAIKKKEMIDKNMDEVINLKIDLSKINENRSNKNKCNDDIDNDLSMSFKI